jgi:hypothetical protein
MASPRSGPSITRIVPREATGAFDQSRARRLAIRGGTQTIRRRSAEFRSYLARLNLLKNVPQHFE